MTSEVKLYSNTQEKRALDDLAGLYSIINACEALETAYTRDAVSSDDYERECKRLISQFKLDEATLIGSGKIRDVPSFMAEYGVNCPRATHRLLEAGVPATVTHASHDNRGVAAIVAETTQAYITTLDALKLEQRAVDEIQPLMSDLMGSLTRVPGLNVSTFDGCKKVEEWLSRLNQLRAVDNLSEDDARQLIHDLDQSYTAFHAFLKAGV